MIPRSVFREGIFKPKIMETLRPDLEVHIGEKFLFRVGWEIEKEDSEDYQGQLAYIPHTGCHPVHDLPEPYMGWVPAEDIEFLE